MCRWRGLSGRPAPRRDTRHPLLPGVGQERAGFSSLSALLLSFVFGFDWIEISPASKVNGTQLTRAAGVERLLSSLPPPPSPPSPSQYFVSSGFAFIHADSTTDIMAVEAVPVDQLNAEVVKKVRERSPPHSSTHTPGKETESATCRRRRG